MPRITPAQLAWAAEKLEALETPVELRVTCGEPNDPMCQGLADAVRAIAAQSSKIELAEVQASAGADWPVEVAFANLRWAAAIAGHELEPFVEAILLASRRGRVSPRSDLNEMVTIVTVIAEDCPRCPAMVRRIARLAASDARIEASFVDATLWNRTRQPLVRATPTVVVGDLRLVGYVTDEDLIRAVRLQTDDAALEVALRSQLGAGEVEQVLETAAAHPVAVPLLLAAFVGAEEFSLRLGAMTALEALAGSAPQVALRAAGVLRGYLRHDSASIRGDAAWLLGTLGATDAVTDLEILASDADPDVAEAAAEALARIRGH